MLIKFTGWPSSSCIQTAAVARYPNYMPPPLSGAGRVLNPRVFGHSHLSIASIQLTVVSFLTSYLPIDIRRQIYTLQSASGSIYVMQIHSPI